MLICSGVVVLGDYGMQLCVVFVGLNVLRVNRYMHAAGITGQYIGMQPKPILE